MREFKIDITLAAELAQFLEGLLEAEFNEEFDSEEPCTDTYLDQFMPNGFVPRPDLIKALLKSGVIKKFEKDPTGLEAYDLVPIPGAPGEFRAVKKV
jgi:hypothetical protein